MGSWALLPPSFHPYRALKELGGIVSVALSLRSPWVAVNNHPVLELFGLSSPSKLGAITNLLALLFYQIIRICLVCVQADIDRCIG